MQETEFISLSKRNESCGVRVNSCTSNSRYKEITRSCDELIHYQNQMVNDQHADNR